MKTATQDRLTKKELAARWECSVRTAERRVRQYALHPCDFIGHQPVFELAAIERMETRRFEHIRTQLGYTNGARSERIISVKEAKRRAGRGKAVAS